MSSQPRPVAQLLALKEMIARTDYAITGLLKTAEELRQEFAYEQAIAVLAQALTKVDDKDLLAAMMSVALFRLAGAESEWGSS